jgi:MinD superfamily P-loop ATPase
VSRWAAGFLGDFFHGMSIKMVKTSDRAYHADERCTGCGTCERVCPRANVKLADGKPKWHGNCGMCQACFQWCPQSAIQMADTTHDQPRNHRAGVSLDDMFVR